MAVFTPVFLPGKSHRQRSLTGYSPWGCKRVRQDLKTKQQQMCVPICVYLNFISELSVQFYWSIHSCISSTWFLLLLF